MKRRQALTALTALSAAAWSPAQSQGGDNITALLRTGGCAIMIRHAATEPGVGDPPNFVIGNCSTQRNLSAEGRAQSQRLGQWFTARQLRARSVQSSAWCRCRDTAELAFGQHTVLPALNSTFSDSRNQVAQTQTLRRLLQSVPAGQFDVWVTHQVNITSLTGEWASNAEAFIISASGQLLARGLLS
jgi:phosphohistidine phosphatase SixA